MKQITSIKQLTKGQKVRVTNNEIFGYMGYDVVTGSVFLLNLPMNTFSIQCDQTGAIELVTLESGIIEAIG